MLRSQTQRNFLPAHFWSASGRPIGKVFRMRAIEHEGWPQMVLDGASDEAEEMVRDWARMVLREQD